MTSALDDRSWKILLRRIKNGECTPFLGAGACYGTLPMGGEIARKWSGEHSYPMPDTDDLPRVAQYLAVKFDPMYPKEEILEGWFKEDKTPDFAGLDEPHRVLASLPLSIYMTTNYDDFMVQALIANHKDPQRELCRWNKYMRDKYRNNAPLLDTFEPTSEKPVVFYLHGHRDEKKSLVLTEDDYLDFLVNIARDETLLPARIQEALAYTSLMFVGYSLQDWDFRVLFRGLVSAKESGLRQISIAVQLPPSEKAEIRTYMDEYFENMDVRVYWGTAREFADELRLRWKAFNDGG